MGNLLFQFCANQLKPKLSLRAVDFGVIHKDKHIILFLFLNIFAREKIELFRLKKETGDAVSSFTVKGK